MATKNFTVSNAADAPTAPTLENRLIEICIEMEGIKEILNKLEDDAPEVGNVLFLVVKAVGRINDDLNEIAVLTRHDRKDVAATEEASHD